MTQGADDRCKVEAPHLELKAGRLKEDRLPCVIASGETPRGDPAFAA